VAEVFSSLSLWSLVMFLQTDIEMPESWL